MIEIAENNSFGVMPNGTSKLSEQMHAALRSALNIQDFSWCYYYLRKDEGRMIWFNSEVKNCWNGSVFCYACASLVSIL